MVSGAPPWTSPGGPPVGTLVALAIGALLGLAAWLLAAEVTSEIRLYTRGTPSLGAYFVPYALVGSAAVGGVVGALFHRHRTAAPAVVAIALLAAAVVQTVRPLQRVEAALRAVRDLLPSAVDGATALELVVLAWPPILVGLALVAGAELFLTSRRTESAARD